MSREKDIDIYISVGLKKTIEPKEFADIIDSLLVENINDLQSWGVHTESQWLNIVKEQENKIEIFKKDMEYWNDQHSKETERADKLQKENESLREKLDWMDKNYRKIKFEEKLQKELGAGM